MKKKYKYNEYHICLNDEEDELLRRRAAAANRKPGQYIKELILSDDGKIYNLNIITNDLNEHTALIYRLVKKIEGLIITINQSGKAYPQDIAKIEALLTEIREENRRGYKINSEERIKLYYEALDLIKIKTL